MGNGCRLSIAHFILVIAPAIVGSSEASLKSMRRVCPILTRLKITVAILPVTTPLAMVKLTDPMPPKAEADGGGATHPPACTFA